MALHLNPDLVQIISAADKEVGKNSLGILAEYILTQGGNQPHRIGGAAGAGIPARPLGQHMAVAVQLPGNPGIYLQGIHIEEPLTVQLHSAQDPVVQLQLDDVGVFSVQGDIQHLLAEKHHADGGAGFRVGGIVGQVVVDGKGLALHGGADGAGDIHPFLNDVLPQRFTGQQQAFVPDGGRQIRHGGVQVYRPDGVALRAFLLPHRGEALVVFGIRRVHGIVLPVPVLPLLLEPIRVLAPAVDEILGHIPVLFLPGGMIHPHQANFHLRVAGNTLDFPGADVLGNVVRHPLHDLQKGILPGGFIVGNGSLHHVTGAVQLVAFQQILVSVLRLLDGEIGVQVAIRLLGPSDDVDHRVRPLFQIGVRPDGQGVGHPLQPFGHVTVLEDHAIEFSLFQSRSNAEIGHGMALFRAGDPVMENIFLVVNGGVQNQLLLGAPEGIPDGSLFQCNRLGLFPNHGIAPFVSHFKWIRAVLPLYSIWASGPPSTRQVQLSLPRTSTVMVFPWRRAEAVITVLPCRSGI